MTSISPDRTKAPEIHNMGKLELPEDNITVLSNGMTLHTLSGGDSEVSRIKIVMPGGLAESPRPKLFNVANSLLLEGTANHHSDVLSEILEYNGAWTGTETSTHHSSLSLFCINNSFNSLLPLVREMIVEPAYENVAVKNVLNTEAARLAVENHKVAYRASCAMRKLIYGPDSRIAAEPTTELLLNYKPDDLRWAHEQRLDTTGIHVYLSGLLTDKMITDTSDIFSAITTPTSFSLSELHFPSTYQNKSIHVDMPGSMQSCVKISIPTIGRRHPDFVPLRMAVMALGGFFGSRLMLNIREDKGLTYGITASLLGFPDKSFISITSQTDPSTVEMLIDETIKEIDRMKDPDSYTADEINRVSRFVLSELAGVLDSPFSRMDFLGTKLTAGTPAGYYAMQEEAARNLSAENLAMAAGKYFDTESILTVVAGKK